MNRAYTIAPLVAAVGFLIMPFLLHWGDLIMVVTSDSMLPTLKPYDMIVVKKIDIKDVDVGDIITFDSHIDGIGIVAHRAIEIFDDNGQVGIGTQGDNVEEPDGWTVHAEDFIGRITSVTPGMGFLLIDPVRYGIVAIIVITAVSLLHEVMAKPKAA